VAVLNTTVYVHSGSTSQAFGPGVEIPAEIAAQITNPNVWVGGRPVVAANDVSFSPPPKRGPGSGVSAWTKFAALNQFTVEPDASRDEIIAALESEGIATE
jgi:hypothetical protein